MIIVLVIGLFLALSYQVYETISSVSSLRNFTENIYRKQQAYHVAVSTLPFVLEALRREDQSIDTLQDRWALPFVFETEEGSIEISIYDEDRFFNLNTLPKGRIQKEIFARLLELLDISSAYVDVVLGWMGKGSAPLSDYPPKGSALDSVEELLYMGFKKEDLYGKSYGNVSYPGLLSLVTVYSSGKINVNTAPKYVLMALDPRIDSSLADRIIAYREKKPFRNLQDLVLVEGFTFDILYRIQDVIDVKSTHFRINLTVKSKEEETTFEAVYDRARNRIIYLKVF